MEQRRVSRRELLRSIGIAGAAVWAAPVLRSRSASASIDRCLKKKSRKLCGDQQGDACYACVGYDPCGTCSSDVGDGSYCFVRFGHPRGCFCAEDVFCSEAGTCTSDDDCKAQRLGNICITANGCTGCDDLTGVCSTRCCTGLAGSAPAIKRRRLGRTAVVR